MTTRRLFASLMLALSLTALPFSASAAGSERGNNGNRSHSSSTNRGNKSNNGHSSRPSQNHNTKPSQNHNTKPSAPVVRPGNNPGHNPGHTPAPAVRPGNHAPAPAVRPGNVHHDNGNHFGHYKYRNNWAPWRRPMPVRPPRPHVHIAAPPINVVLGLTFGSLINNGINALIRAGYNVLGSASDAIYLANVARYGVTWPEATIYYGNGGMSGARFQYGSRTPGYNHWETAYAQLCREYGTPIEQTVSNGSRTVTWWGGNNTGYITLQYNTDYQSGYPVYYTDLIYGN